MSIQIYNSLSRDKELFEPKEPGKVGIYVCGMTVYDFCHIGHARVLVVFDMVVRVLRAKGFDVKYIRNITDIDDKIIARATELGEPFNSLTERFISCPLYTFDDADEYKTGDREERRMDNNQATIALGYDHSFK